jgi:hypothetical protein
MPSELRLRELNLGAYSLESQFQSQLLEQRADVIVLSILSDVMNGVVRHRHDGYRLFAPDSGSWSPADRRWFEEEMTPAYFSTPQASMDSLANVVALIRGRYSPSVLVFNMSAVVPGERLVSHRGLEDALSTRIRAFNLALIEASAKLDVSIVDVDRVLAGAGAERLKIDAIHYTPEAQRLIASEVVRILEDRGHFDA